MFLVRALPAQRSTKAALVGADLCVTCDRPAVAQAAYQWPGAFGVQSSCCGRAGCLRALADVAAARRLSLVGG